LVEYAFIESAAAIGTAIATIALVILLYRTIKQMEATVHLSRVQTEYRFRPWVGPNNSIKEIPDSINGKRQFDVGIKNFGEIPAEYVKAFFKLDNKMMSKDFFKSDQAESFNLGPMLPNMEKHYWFFIEPELMEKAKEGTEKIFTAMYFEYPVTGGKSGYGMLSEYNPATSVFIHKEMWVESPNSLQPASKGKK